MLLLLSPSLIFNFFFWCFCPSDLENLERRISESEVTWARVAGSLPMLIDSYPIHWSLLLAKIFVPDEHAIIPLVVERFDNT